MHRPFIHPYAYSIIILLFTISTADIFILLLLLLFCYCHYYKTVATDKLLRASLFPGAAELTTHLLRLINILWLPLCRINKFGFYFPRRLLRSPILVGHQAPSQTDLGGRRSPPRSRIKHYSITEDKKENLEWAVQRPISVS
jgi:hypothetical protein